MIGEKEIGEKITPWQRRDMVLKNTNSTIKLKLWGEKADEITEEHDGATFLFTNVEVDMFKQKPELKTTNLTRLEILSQPPDKSIKVVKQIICGIDPTVEHMVLLTKECKQLICDHEVFKSLSLGVDAFRSLFPVECNITADQQNKVTTITIARH
ncbi:uncharacterized protein [Antedon mediterranea]|uniref:uncharacterized protein n=1 Tax=Antedon mediterranea TaxID=105859 RepID=UPI003AF8B6D8